MKITLQYKELLFDITNKNRAEVASLDAATRYRSEIGSDKEDEVRRCLSSALSTLSANYVRLISSAGIVSADNQPFSSDKVEIDLNGSERRFSGKETAIASIMHSALVSMTLSLFYISCGQSSLTKLHDELAANDIQVLKRLLYSKTPPQIC